jgi:hypothetical protein
MRHHNSLMHELLQLIPWGRFERLVDEYEADKRVRLLLGRRAQSILASAVRGPCWR